MDKKTKTILLIIVALLVWGYSALEWFNYIDASDDVSRAKVSSYMPISTPIKLKSNEPVELLLNYRDPFLNGYKRKKVGQDINSIYKPKVKQNKKIATLVKEEVKWPEIEYTGVINNSLGLLKINGKDYIVKEGDIKDNVFIVTVLSDKIILEFNYLIKEIVKIK